MVDGSRQMNLAPPGARRAAPGIDLGDAVVTSHALHTQRNHAAHLLGRGKTPRGKACTAISFNGPGRHQPQRRKRRKRRTSRPRPANPFWLAGRRTTATDTFDVTHPYDGSPVGRVCVPTKSQTEQAVAAAHAARGECAALPAHRRADALAHVSRRLTERTEEIAQLITAENGKPVSWARAEAGRAASVFRLAAEEARRFTGEVHRLDTEPAGTGRMAVVRKTPRGPVLAIDPFNFPLNLVAHKAAPAIAAGCPVLVKPAPATPLSALLLGEILAETDLPPGSWSVLPVPNERMPGLVADPRLPVVSFTGSGPVGWAVRRSVPDKQVTLELGGNAAAVVCADYGSEADLDRAAQRIAAFGTYQAGHARAAERVEQWVNEAVTSGATLLTGGHRQGTTYAPTVLSDAPRDAKVVREEVFGPVLVVDSVDGVDDAVEKVNDSAFGLQAGVFTHDLHTAFRMRQKLDVGGVVIGDVPSYRADQVPYGGVKASGVGREGVRYAMEDFTEIRSLVLTGLAL